MHTNVVPQNCKKSEIIIIGRKSVTDSIQNFRITHLPSYLQPWYYFLGSHLSFDQHLAHLRLVLSDIDASITSVF